LALYKFIYLLTYLLTATQCRHIRPRTQDKQMLAKIRLLCVHGFVQMHNSNITHTQSKSHIHMPF